MYKFLVTAVTAVPIFCLSFFFPGTRSRSYMAHVRNRIRTLPRYESCDRTRGRTACTELTCTTVPGRYGTVSPEFSAMATTRRAATAREAHNEMGRRTGNFRQQVRVPVGKRSLGSDRLEKMGSHLRGDRQMMIADREDPGMWRKNSRKEGS